MIVKIQNRRGGYTDYDPSKLLPGEFAVVQMDDPNTPTGKGVYLAITAGDVVRLATTEEIAAYTQQFDDIYQSTLQDAGVILDEAKVLISNYTGNLTVVDSISDMTDTSSLYLYNGSGEYKNYVYVYDPSQSAFVPLMNYGMFADLSEQISQNASNIATNTSNIATNAANIATNTASINTNTASINTNTTRIAANTTNIATNASNITENATNIAGLATGVTNKVVKTTLSTTQTYANATTDTYNYLSIPGISDYEIVMVRADCANLRQWLTFVNGDNTPLYLREYAGTNSIRGGYYVDWTNERIGVRYLGATGAYTSANVYFTNVVGFVKQGAIDGSGSDDFDPYQALYDAIVGYVDEHYATEMIDARIGYDGTVHTSLGTAVREQIRELHETGGVQGIGIDTIVALTQEEYDGIQTKSDTTLYIITDGSGGGLPYYTVTNELTNISTNNSATSVLYGNVYTATLTPDENYFIDTVTVTMGGVDITSSVYNSGVISIPSVTGKIVITAVGDTTLVTYPYLQSDGTAFITLDEAANSLDIEIEVATAHVDTTTNTNGYAILGASAKTIFTFEDKQWTNFSLLNVRAAYKETDRTTRHVYKATPTALYRDGVVVVTRSAGTGTNAAKISVFKTTNSANVNAYVKIYNVKIYNGETLIADYTPVEHEGVPCLYDSVGDKYAYNSAGSGALIYGEELGEA